LSSKSCRENFKLGWKLAMPMLKERFFFSFLL